MGSHQKFSTGRGMLRFEFQRPHPGCCADNQWGEWKPSEGCRGLDYSAWNVSEHFYKIDRT